MMRSRMAEGSVGASMSAVAIVAFSVLLGGGPIAFAADRSGGTLSGHYSKSGDGKDSEPVEFTFHREEIGAGRISVQLGPHGKRYVGSYLRLTGSRPHSRIRVFYTYWVSDAFEDYSYGPGGGAFNRTAVTIEQFQRRYSGSVVAKLVGEGGGGMRCLFKLNDPNGGLAGGVTGRCQSSDGGEIILGSKTQP